jgi:hypothetical protein
VTDDQIAQLLVANMTVMDRLIRCLETGQSIDRIELAKELDDIASHVENPTGRLALQAMSRMLRDRGVPQPLKLV